MSIEDDDPTTNVSAGTLLCTSEMSESGGHSIRSRTVTDPPGASRRSSGHRRVLPPDVGVPLRDRQDLARHADLKTTRRYDRSRHALHRTSSTFGRGNGSSRAAGPTTGGRPSQSSSDHPLFVHQQHGSWPAGPWCGTCAAGEVQVGGAVLLVDPTATIPPEVARGALLYTTIASLDPRARPRSSGPGGDRSRRPRPGTVVRQRLSTTSTVGASPWALCPCCGRARTGTRPTRGRWSPR